MQENANHRPISIFPSPHDSIFAPENLGFDFCLTVPGQSVLPGTRCCTGLPQTDLGRNRRRDSPPICGFGPVCERHFSRSTHSSPISTPETCYLASTQAKKAVFGPPGALGRELRENGHMGRKSIRRGAKGGGNAVSECE